MRKSKLPFGSRFAVISGLAALMFMSTSCGNGSSNAISSSNGGNGGGGVPLPPPASGSPIVRFVTTGGGLFQGVFLPALHFVFATNTILNEVDVISTDDLSIRARIPVPKPYGIDASPDGKHVYVGTSVQSLVVIDPVQLQVVQNVVPPNSQASWFPVCLGNKVLLTAQLPSVAPDILLKGGQLILWDPSSNSFQDISSLLSVSPGVGNLVARTGDATKLFVGNFGNNGTGLLAVYDVASGTVSQGSIEIPANIVTAVAANFDGTQFMVSVGGQPFFYDQHFKQLNSSSVNVGVNYWGSGYTLDNRYFYGASSYTANSETNTAVVVVDTTNFQVSGYIPAVFSSNPVIPLAFDQGGNLIVSGSGGMGVIPFKPSLTLSSGISFYPPPRWDPAQTSPGKSIQTQANSVGFEDNMKVYFGSTGVSTISVVTNSYGPLTVEAPPLSVQGPVNTTLEFPDGWFTLLPNAFSYGPTALQLTLSGGPAEGGNQVQLYGYGFNYSPSDLQVTVGGKPATISSAGLTNISNAQPVDEVTFTIPPGAPGFADVSLTTPTGSATLRKAYEYLATATVVPAQSNLSQVIFDSKRNLVYASAGNTIPVFSPQTMQFLQPIQPPGGALNAAYKGLALTPDSSLLVVADGANHAVAIVNPDNPSQGQTVVLSNPSSTTCIPPSNELPFSQPNWIATTSTGKAFIEQSVGISSTVELDLASGQFQYRCDIFDQSPIAASEDGSKVVFAAVGGFPGAVGTWDATTDSFTSQIIYSTLGDVTVSADGMRVVSTDEDQLDPFNNSYLFDSSLRLLNYTFYPDLAPPQGRWVPGIKLNSTGSLYVMPRQQGIDIIDAQTGALREQIVTPEPLLTPQNVVNVLNGIALDDVNRRIFAISASGLTVLQLPTFPLGIGTIQPNQGPPTGGVLVTVHGSGFAQGAQVSFGSQLASTTFIDQETLTFTAPASMSGAVRISINNPDGSSYSLDAAYVVQ